MGAEADVVGIDRGCLSPLAQWSALFAGPAAWAVDLCASYALVKWSCLTNREAILHVITVVALVVVGGASIASWVALRLTGFAGPTSGSHPLERARFLAVLGLTSDAFFAVAIVALAIPLWVLDACQ